MMNRKRITAVLLCVGLVLALAVSSVCIALETDHDCSGEDCPVCHMIAASTEFLRIAGLAVLLPVLIALATKNAVRKERQRFVLSASGTLVSWKIRLND